MRSAILGVVAGDAEVSIGRGPGRVLFLEVFHVKRKVLLHVDVLKVLTALRELEPDHARFANAPRGALDKPLFRVAYDADLLLAGLNDMVYKFVREAG